jgi:pyruvate formate lyase activating enzyme
VLSFGTAGCNLACRFCQNWDISKSKENDTLADRAAPETLAEVAREAGAASVAFTYNDPTIFMEYAIDTAIACREAGVRTVAVTAGYINAEPRAELYQHIDAANVDLKGFTEDFYRHVAMGQLAPVLETLEYLVHETDTWVEITTLLIPGQNDSDEELGRLSAWIGEHLGPDVPLHFTAFHPDFKMLDIAPTPPTTLARARSLALREGLHHVYTGNVHDLVGGTTRCTGCGAAVIERDWYDLRAYRLDDTGACTSCGTTLAGTFDGPPGSFGRRRIPIAILDSRVGA